MSKLSGFMLILALLAGWEALARSGLVEAVSFPPFSTVFATFWSLIVSGKMVFLLLPSVERLLIGYVLAVVIGVAFGIAMGYFAAICNLFEPLTEILRPIPSPAYIP